MTQVPGAEGPESLHDESVLVAIALTLSSSALLGQNQDATLVNGVNGFIDVPANPSLVPATGITLEAWVFFNNAGLNPTNLYPTIARKNVGNGQEEYFMRVQGTGVLRWKIKVSATLSLTVDSPTPMPGYPRHPSRPPGAWRRP